jgi:hypothetical protein
MIGYPPDRLKEELAFIAYHFHWSHDAIMNFEHKDRQAWCEEISRINAKMNKQESPNNTINLEDVR